MPLSAEIKAKVSERWPSYSWLVDNPEIADLLEKAINEDWAPDLFASKLKMTAWFQQRPTAARVFQREATDQASAVQMVNDTKVQIKAMAATLGTTIDDETAGRLSWDFHRKGLTDTELKQMVASTVKPAGAPAINVRAMADKWMVSLSDQQVNDYTQRLFTGEIDQQGLTALMQVYATSQFPQLADVVAKGISPGDYFDPYKQRIAEMTDLNPNAIDLKTDPVWSRIISTADEKTGAIRPMSLNEAEKYIRSSDAYGNSRTGQKEAASWINGLAKEAGAKR